MPSFKISAVALAAALFAIGARNQAIYSIDPNSVPISTRTQWCQSQTTECPLLCLQLPGSSSTTNDNECNPDDLTYSCICGNGQSPNASEYSQTLPYFMCQEYGNQCVAQCGGNTACESSCRVDHPCGAQNPTRVNASTSTSATASATGGTSKGTDGVVYNGLGGAEATSTSDSSSGNKKNGGQTALDLGRSYGLAVVFTGLFAGFALVM